MEPISEKDRPPVERLSPLNDERLVYVTNDKEALREYHMREMALSDWTSGVNYARQEGSNEKQNEIARNLKAMGDPVDKIARVTGLTVEQIEML
jgi:predicted transposase/invertase (TIGR01784 family)